MQRTGDRTELLRGPLLYGLVIAALTALFWRDSPAGALGIAVLCAGDGMADIVGRRYGDSNKLFYSPQKARMLLWVGPLQQQETCTKQGPMLALHACRAWLALRPAWAAASWLVR